MEYNLYTNFTTKIDILNLQIDNNEKDLKLLTLMLLEKQQTLWGSLKTDTFVGQELDQNQQLLMLSTLSSKVVAHESKIDASESDLAKLSKKFEYYANDSWQPLKANGDVGKALDSLNTRTIDLKQSTDVIKRQACQIE